MMVKTAVGRGRREKEGERGRKREKEGERGRRSGKARVADQTAGMAERASMHSSIGLSEPQGRDEKVASEEA
jgi:hypothetical protein